MNETSLKSAEEGNDALWVALLSGSSSPLTASYPIALGPTVALVRELFVAWRGRR